MVDRDLKELVEGETKEEMLEGGAREKTQSRTDRGRSQGEDPCRTRTKAMAEPMEGGARMEPGGI